LPAAPAIFRYPPEAVGQLDRRRSSHKEPFAGDRESQLRAMSGNSGLNQTIRASSEMRTFDLASHCALRRRG
jgi:hypothetical protein